MLLQEGGDPNVEGRDGSLPLMVCLVPLVNRDHLHHFTHTMKVCYLNCVRILLKYGANPNCSSRSNLTPLHVLNFAATGKKFQHTLLQIYTHVFSLFLALKWPFQLEVGNPSFWLIFVEVKKLYFDIWIDFLALTLLKLAILLSLIIPVLY